MNVVESAFVSTLLVSIPAVFEQEGTPRDMDYILSYLKKAVCHRGITTSTQKLIVHLLVPLSSFKGGLIDHEELKKKVVWEVPSSLDIQLHIAGVEKLTCVEELKELAVKLCDYSKQECIKQSSISSAAVSAKPASESEEGGDVSIDQVKRILYNRDQLLFLRALGSSSENLDLKLPNIFKAKKNTGHNHSSNRIPPSSQHIADLSAIFPPRQQRKLPMSPSSCLILRDHSPQSATTYKFPSPSPSPTSAYFPYPPTLSLTATIPISSSSTPSNGTSSGSPCTVPLHKTTNFPHTPPSPHITPSGPITPASSSTPVSSHTTSSPITPASSHTTSSPTTPVSSHTTSSPITPASSRTTPSPTTPVGSRTTPSPHNPVSPHTLVCHHTLVSSHTTSSPRTLASSRTTPSPRTPVGSCTTPSPHNPVSPHTLVCHHTLVSSHTTSSPRTLASSRTTPSPRTPVGSCTTPSPRTPVGTCTTPSPHNPVSPHTLVCHHTLVSSGDSPLTSWECIHGRRTREKIEPFSQC